MGTQKRILIVHRYFYPDTPAYAVMLKKIAEYLSNEGCQTHVLTTMPSYYGASGKNAKKRENIGNVQVRRLRLLKEKNRNFFVRGINTLLYATIVFFKILFRKRYHLIMVATTPPIIMAMVVRLASAIKGSDYLYHCQDIYPEIAYYNNDLRSKRVFNFLKSIDLKNDNGAKSIVVLSSDMERTLIKDRGVRKEKITIINNFIRTDAASKGHFDYNKFGIKKEDFKVVFCGNLGKLQNLNHIMDIAVELRNEPRIKFVFIGEGVEKESLMSRSTDMIDKTVFFLGYLQSDIAINALKASDLGVVSISDPTYKTAYPSKTMTYLNAGLPTMVFVNKEAELANFIKKEKLGIVVSPDNIEEAKDKILDLAYSDSFFDKNHIRRVAEREFGEKTILKKWSELIKRL